MEVTIDLVSYLEFLENLGMRWEVGDPSLMSWVNWILEPVTFFQDHVSFVTVK